MAQITLARGRCWQYSHYIGRGGQAGMGFSNPAGAAPAKNGILFVANRGSGANGHVVPRIVKATVDQEFIKEFGRGTRDPIVGDAEQPAPFPSRNMWLTAVALDQDENVYVTDEWQNAVIVFDNDGELLKTWGEQGDEEDKLNGPSGMAFDDQDNIWIVNSSSSRIQKFTKGGQYLGGFGEKGSGEGELDMPWGITIDNEGDIYVADWNNDRVQKFDTDGSHLLTFGSGRKAGISPDGGTPYSHTYQSHIAVNPRDLNHPTGVAVDADGDVYVVDWMNERLVIFDDKADPLTTLRGDASGLSKWAELSVAADPDIEKARRRVKTPEIQNYFRMPVDCAFDQANNRLIVCDTQRSRLQIYHKDSEYINPPSTI